MDWLPSSWSQSLNKRVCRFIIHRYLGHLLKEKLDLKQLTVDLYDGVGTIKDLNVDTEVVKYIHRSKSFHYVIPTNTFSTVLNSIKTPNKNSRQ